MRNVLRLLAALLPAATLAACGSAASSGGSSGTGGSNSSSSASCSNASIQKYLYQKGKLTVATDSPAYWPWFFHNKPSDGRGYESAVAYAVAKKLGFSKSQVHWVVEPFDNSYTPGPKKFDFDINEISYTPQRAQQVTFSSSYYDVQQAVVALKTSQIAKRHSPAQLRKYLYGDQVGTTGLTYIEEKLRPTQQPHVYNTLNDVKSALEERRFDACVTDTPTAQYISKSEIPHSTMVGQFPSTGEHYGLLFQKGDKLVSCVDKALSELKSDGTLRRLQRKYLSIYLGVPTIKP
jgi:polar amino acid transport system substrate-binding protein